MINKVKNVIKEFCGEKLDKFEVIDWHDAMEEYGCDKPDLRIPLKLKEISDLVMNEEFKVFSDPAKKEGSRVVALKVLNGNTMSRGQIDIDSTLDLHGMTQEEAKHATINFIKVANKNNLKIILIITGKGISNENTNTRYKNRYERGVLNKNLPAWLQMPEIRDYVNGYRYANQKHGGEGAYYILLKS